MISTRTMAQIVGPFMAIIGASVALRAEAMTLIIPAFLQDAPLAVVAGALTLAMGLVIIAAHQRWDSAAAIVISVLGWIIAIRGALLLLASDFVATILADIMRSAMALTLIGALVTLLGLWLSFVGFSKPRTPKAPS